MVTIQNGDSMMARVATVTESDTKAQTIQFLFANRGNELHNLGALFVWINQHRSAEADHFALWNAQLSPCAAPRRFLSPPPAPNEA